jgi:lipoprotein-releasing system permease protein
MLSGFERMIASRYLRPRRGEGFMFLAAAISVIAITLGVAAMIVVTSLMNGFRGQILDKIVAVNGHALVMGYDGRLKDWRKVLNTVSADPDVRSATPMLIQPLMLSRQNRASGIEFRGIRTEDMQLKLQAGTKLLQGSLKDFKPGEQVIALGEGIATRLFLNVGDTITLIAPNGQATPFGTAPRVGAFRVVAVFQTGVFEYDGLIAFAPLTTAQAFLDSGDAVGQIEVELKTPDLVDQFSGRITPKVREFGVVSDWKDSNKAYFEALQIERMMTFLITTMILVVAAFNIISTLVMLVQIKTKDIAILRTIGLKRKSVLRIFIAAGSIIGVIGIAAGIVVGSIILYFRQGIVTGIGKVFGINIFNPEVYSLYELPSRPDYQLIGVTLVLAFVLTIIATLYPAWKAANTDPVKVLRYD